MEVIYRSLAAFFRNLECWTCSVKKLGHHIQVSRPIKNDNSSCIWAMKQLLLVGVPFDFILRSFDNPELIIHADASFLFLVGGYSDDG